ncbi:large conductance mechanosensitive channel [Mucilaginibacter gracilis]|uniref:Large-conductance mechanosensitive channel n=1 Tax=Mucilaginibacter gracilis TaxID=423350 RepID=A0A495J3U8_9SPHI|nr:large conductance mechanosensitive channel protein MscL [Mucilaginibacter gracilis]RKR83048.1 large conductance mechanosensitive channel [Mucilaginibacter gracilis]
MGFLSEFKQFAVKGNVVDLAVGVIIGAAFGKIVDSVVNDLITPLVGIFFKADFSNIYVPLSSKVPKGLALADAKKLGPVFAWGNFLTVTLNFLILAFIVFLIVKGINALKRREEAKPTEPAAPSKEEVLLTEIRDLLAKKA